MENTRFYKNKFTHALAEIVQFIDVGVVLEVRVDNKPELFKVTLERFHSDWEPFWKVK